MPLWCTIRGEYLTFDNCEFSDAPRAHTKAELTVTAGRHCHRGNRGRQGVGLLDGARIVCGAGGRLFAGTLTDGGEALAGIDPPKSGGTKS